MTPLFRKLNLKHVAQILVLNAPATFETELSALSGVEIVTDADETEQVAFVRAFVMTQVEANAVATTVAKKILGDGVVWCGVPTPKRVQSGIAAISIATPVGKCLATWDSRGCAGLRSTTTGPHSGFDKSSLFERCLATRPVP